MDRWDLIIILVAAYVAVMTLVRLMAHRHNQMLGNIRKQLTEQLNKKKMNTKKKKKKIEDQPTQEDRGAA